MNGDNRAHNTNARHELNFSNINDAFGKLPLDFNWRKNAFIIINWRLSYEKRT